MKYYTYSSKLFFTVSFTFFLFSLTAQTNIVDSLKTAATYTSDKKEIAETYNKISDQYLDIDFTIARKYADSAISIGKEIHNFKIVSDGYVNHANSYFFQCNFDSTLIYFKKSYLQIIKSGNQNEIAASLNRLGLIYEAKSDFGKASEYYYKSLKIYEKAKNKKGMADINNNLGVIYDDHGKAKESLKYYETSLALYKEINDEKGIANIYNNLASYYTFEKPDTALMFIRKAIYILVKRNNKYDAGTAYYNASILFEKINKGDSARIYLDSALIFFEQIENKHGIANIYNQEAKLFSADNRFDEAINLLFKSLELRKEVGNLLAESETLFQISDTYKKSHDFEKALEFYETYIELRDSVINKTTQTKISELNIKYETDKKDTQINLLKKDAEIKKSHNLFLNFLIITLLLIMILLFFIIRVKTKLLKSQKTSYEQQEKVNSLLLQKQEIERDLLEKEVKNQHEINLLQKNKFDAELEHSRRELITSTMHLLNKNKILISIKDIIEEIPGNNSTDNRTHREITKIIDNSINLDSDWEQFKLHFESVNTGFFDELLKRYNELSQTDLRVCAYLRINLSYKEIAQMMNISLAGVHKRLYRLRKKMNLDSDINIAKFMTEL